VPVRAQFGISNVTVDPVGAGARVSDLPELFVHFQSGQRARAAVLLATETREVTIKPELPERRSAQGRTPGDGARADTV
jgi:hypothetical protein